MARIPTSTALVVLSLAAVLMMTLSASTASAQTYYLAEDYSRGRAEQVETGYYHMCVLTHCGGIECGGGNWWGEGSAPDDRDFIDVAAGALHSCGLHDDGTAECWGDNSYGQLEVPEDVVLTSIDGGWYHTCGITDDQRMVCWGDDTYGQLEPEWGDRGERFLSVEAGAAFTCATAEFDGWLQRVLCWGMDYHGQMDYPADPYSDEALFLSYERITAGYGHGCALDTGTSQAVCWGYDSHGQVTTENPDGSANAFHNLHWGEHDGLAIQWGLYLSDISAGTLHTCAVRFDGQLECWGDDGWYQSSPPPGEFTQVSAGDHSSCAIDTAGYVECWGYDIYESLTLPDLSYACADNVTETGWNYSWWLY
jgi:alpha-tubulin suppressor-like RCC1 family protein